MATASPKLLTSMRWPRPVWCSNRFTATARCARPRAFPSCAAARSRPSARTTTPRNFPRKCRLSHIILRRAGYQTVLSGKMHFCGADQLHGFEERLTTDIYPADFGWTPDWNRFEHRPSWYHTMDSVTQAGPCSRTNQIDFDDDVVFQARQKLFDMARAKDRRPFCMVASMTHPHDPYVIPHRYWDRYAGVDIDMPRVQLPGRGSRSAFAASAPRLRPRLAAGERGAGARRTARLLRRGVVRRRSGRRTAFRPRRGALRRRHHRAAARRSRRHARGARAVVQNELLRAGLPHTADRARARTLRLPARGAIGLAHRHRADAVRTGRRRTRRLPGAAGRHTVSPRSSGAPPAAARSSASTSRRARSHRW